jgi:hypothetical protein
LLQKKVGGFWFYQILLFHKMNPLLSYWRPANFKWSNCN